MKKTMIAVVATAAAISFAGAASAMDFPATPMNSGPYKMMPMEQPMAQPMSEPMEKPMMKKRMSMRQKKMMMKKKMIMKQEQ